MLLFKELVLTAPIRAKLQFGHNHNVIVEKVDFNERKNKGITVKLHTFITLAQVDDDRKVIARTEGNFFNLDHTTDYVWNNFMDEFTCQAAIVEAVGGNVEEFDAAVGEVFGDDNPEEFVKTKQGSETAQEFLQNAFMDAIEGKTGDDCPLLACKMVSNKAGWLEFPKEMGWIVPIEEKDELPAMSAFEKKRYQEGLAAQDANKQAKPDAVGAAPTGTAPPTKEKKSAATLLNSL
jgi:hypothetical protein